jgi:hypothetical protein
MPWWGAAWRADSVVAGPGRRELATARRGWRVLPGESQRVLSGGGPSRSSSLSLRPAGPFPAGHPLHAEVSAVEGTGPATRCMPRSVRSRGPAPPPAPSRGHCGAPSLRPRGQLLCAEARAAHGPAPPPAPCRGPRGAPTLGRVSAFFRRAHGSAAQGRGSIAHRAGQQVAASPRKGGSISAFLVVGNLGANPRSRDDDLKAVDRGSSPRPPKRAQSW